MEPKLAFPLQIKRVTRMKNYKSLVQKLHWIIFCWKWFHESFINNGEIGR